MRKITLQPRHGRVFEPASRGQLCADGENPHCKFEEWIVNGLESGKFFPATEGGLTDPFAKDDVLSALPPPDGKIASAGHAEAAVLDEQSATRWNKHEVKAGQALTFSWTYSALHATRRWNYFITKADWNPDMPLSRSQFEDTPFYVEQLEAQPYWSHDDELTPPDPTVHKVTLPDRSGYHVVLAVWEVANTANAFYQVIDFNFA